MLHKPNPNNVKPCWHMQTLVSAWTDGKLKGLAKWYTERHVADCPQCQSSLPFLKELHGRLFTLAGQTPPASAESLAEERWEAVENAWKEAETKQSAIIP
jgi:hypothetical protein